MHPPPSHESAPAAPLAELLQLYMYGALFYEYDDPLTSALRISIFIHFMRYCFACAYVSHTNKITTHCRLHRNSQSEQVKRRESVSWPWWWWVVGLLHALRQLAHLTLRSFTIYDARVQVRRRRLHSAHPFTRRRRGEIHVRPIRHRYVAPHTHTNILSTAVTVSAVACF